MAQILFNMRIDEQLKKDMECICNELGISMSAAFTIFAKKMSREKRIPFDVSVDPFYSDVNMKAIVESREQIKQGKIVVKTIAELEAMEK